MEEALLTTLDNPYSPHNQFEEWHSYDIRQGYNTLALLDRMIGSIGDYNTLDYVMAATTIARNSIEADYVLVTDKQWKALFIN